MIEVLFDLVFSGVFDIVLEVVYRLLGETGRARSRSHPVVAGLGLILVGVAAGGFVTWLWPQRVFDVGPFRGASLVISPLVNGAVMAWWGRYQARGGVEPSYTASFWGGALFALTMALTRFMLVGN